MRSVLLRCSLNLLCHGQSDLSGLDLVAQMIDGVHFAESCRIVELGIDISGVKHPLALVEGSTENATLVTTCWSTFGGSRRHPSAAA